MAFIMEKLNIAMLLILVYQQILLSSSKELYQGHQERDEAAENKHKELFKGSSSKPTTPSDKDALEEFYHSTAGPAWLQNAGWLSGDPCQSMWYGIRCTPSGDVVEITLSHNGLAGQLPPKLSEMKNLQILRLYDNYISGILPISMFTIQSLIVLDLDQNQLSGNLPSVISLPYLTNLSLASNQIDGFMPYSWNCPNLQSVSVSSNNMIGPLPSSLSKLPKLKYLDLSDNIFTGPFPPEISALTSLETLLFQRNRGSSGVAPTIPESWHTLVNLKNFQVDGLSGDLPDIFDSWSKLEVLKVTFGQLTGEIPMSLCNLKSLQTLVISNNMITGTLPSCICKLSSTTMTSIDLSSNHLTGHLPDCFGSLHNLTDLTLASNNFSGNLPASLGACSHLNSLYLAYNRFTGSIPYTYAKLELKTLEIQGNKLSTVDDGLEQFFTGISFCSLYDNPWSCPLPTYLSNNTNCNPTCSKCNSLDKHTSCKACVSSSECGWCTEGPNCLEGTNQGPTYEYNCEPSNWIYGIEAACNK
ncbi:PREDICTED: probable leucine-rich repeat receptor-like protein kinase At1g35710 [Amphimedon queenslandica]|uniref:Leucine-rich repeat-containing N-terminal plant-type domain-containing protein n=1 Tax=Amphimedon queenslandica TaxID=400682 RepID=A0A1X7TZ52_AMPQE|nr:PREDICTED: probable leucine-rich repeat receptor-like protein kinase At1g35710 [Amphimedon queenslandica]|eukprot:XP_019856969.1 PREDICTED: probable leucine-rich repeat receptor-like protein kinase At1g35710 [Amphimedon queenslandica]